MHCNQSMANGSLCLAYSASPCRARSVTIWRESIGAKTTLIMLRGRAVEHGCDLMPRVCQPSSSVWECLPSATCASRPRSSQPLALCVPSGTAPASVRTADQHDAGFVCMQHTNTFTSHANTWSAASPGRQRTHRHARGATGSGQDGADIRQAHPACCYCWHTFAVNTQATGYGYRQQQQILSGRSCCACTLLEVMHMHSFQDANESKGYEYN